MLLQLHGLCWDLCNRHTPEGSGSRSEVSAWLRVFRVLFCFNFCGTGLGGMGLSCPTLKVDITKQKHAQHFASTFQFQLLSVMTVYTPTMQLYQNLCSGHSYFFFWKVPSSSQHTFMMPLKQLAVSAHKHRKIQDPGGALSFHWGKDGGGAEWSPLTVDPVPSRITPEEGLDCLDTGLAVGD